MATVSFYALYKPISRAQTISLQDLQWHVAPYLFQHRFQLQKRCKLVLSEFLLHPGPYVFNPAQIRRVWWPTWQQLHTLCFQKLSRCMSCVCRSSVLLEYPIADGMASK